VARNQFQPLQKMETLLLLGHGRACLQLRLYRCLVDYRPYLGYTVVPKSVEDILSKMNSLSVDRQSFKGTLWRAMECEPGSDERWFGYQCLYVKKEVGNRRKIPFQHHSVPGQPKLSFVVSHVFSDKPAELFPVLIVQTSNVLPVKLCEIHRVSRTEISKVSSDDGVGEIGTATARSNPSN
jgi:hypothetical protein